ncbi:MAG TPA: ASPIC/UnbV domain-containing protein, partial [Candidatus Limnocylindrales bacterium]|nr:ASPIC/UnbV domain-containing protein [Candidatus Limnocylindrales bacterium]
MINSADNANHWLMLELIGRYSNRDAIGARVKVTTASGRVLYNHVSVSVGFMSSSDKRVHFGLGGERQIRSIEIRWPRGGLQQVTGVTADRFLKIEEPAPQRIEEDTKRKNAP